MTKELLARRTLVVVLLNLILVMTRLVPFLEKERSLTLLVLPAIFATLVVQAIFWRKYPHIYKEIRETKYRPLIGPKYLRISLVVVFFGFVLTRFLTFDTTSYDLFLNLYGTLIIGLLIFTLAALAWRE